MQGSARDESIPLPAAAVAFLDQCIWPKMLSKHEMETVYRSLYVRSDHAGSYVCRRQELADSWIGVIDGFLRVQDSTEQGDTVMYTGVATGGWIGEGSLLKMEPRKYEIVASRATETLHVSRDTFTWLVDRSIPFNHFLLSHLNERLGQFIAMVRYDRVLQPTARVARGIASLFHPLLYPNMDNTLRLNQEELGWMVGVSRSRVNTAMHELEAAGLLQRGYRSITVLDRQGLARYAA